MRVLGIGSGTTVEMAFDPSVGLAALIRERRLLCVPTSFQAKQLLVQHGLAEFLTDLSDGKKVTFIEPTQI